MCRLSQPKMSAVPSVAQKNHPFIFRIQQFCHIIGTILVMLLIIIDKWRQQIISDLFSSQISFKNTKTTDI